MIDSTNVRVLADNIQKLQRDSSGLASRVSALEATAPKDYSTTETATGQKWIDGKEIYCVVCSGDFVEISTPTNVKILDLTNKINFIKADTTLFTSGGDAYTENSRCKYAYNLDFIELYQVSNSFSTGRYVVIVYYTKPDPTPGRAPEDQEPEPEKKTTKKKTK